MNVLNNGSMPAMPTGPLDSHETHQNGFDESGRYQISNGLTKREMFAMHAMQGILSNSGGVIQGNNYSGTGWCNSNAEDLAKWSLECADALLKQLES